MASMSSPQIDTQQKTQGAKGASSGVGSLISNEAYDVITALQAKLEGLEAYRKYTSDKDPAFWQSIAQHDLETVQLLVDELERLVRDGKLRMRKPGDTKS